MKDVKKLLKEGAREVLPDERVKRNIERGLSRGRGEELAAQTEGGGTVAVKNRNIIIAVCAALLAAAIALCVILPLAGRGGSVLPDGGFIDGGAGGDKLSGIDTADEFYAYGAASVGAVISARAQSASVPTARAAAKVTAQPSGEQMQTINGYLALVEGLLSEGDITGRAVEGASGYDYGMLVGYSDLLGNTVSYVMYYDKIPVSSHAGEDETERYFAIEGVLAVDGVNYPVRGMYSAESEEGEEESSLFFRASDPADASTYIEVEQEREDETEEGESESECEYVYTVYSGGNMLERVQVEYETEEDERELVMTIERGGVRESLVFEDETEDGERVIAVRGDIDGAEVAFRIYVRQGNYHYVFEDGTEQDYDRFDRDDDDDDRRRPAVADAARAKEELWSF